MILGLALVLIMIRPAVAGEEYSCNMSGFTPEELERYAGLATTLRASVQETKELRDGYAFKLPADGLVATSEWIAMERRCCPFFMYELEIPRDSGPLMLRITGGRGIKDFIRTEFEL
jgi:hypothetical protein